MTLLQLKYFIAVAETGNVSKAAGELFVSRPTISRALREIEDEFGVPLFERTNAGLVLTEDGRFFHEKCREIVRKSDLLESQMHAIKESLMPTASRTVKLCVSPTTSLTVFPQLYRELREEYPDIDVVPMEYGAIQARAALEEGTIDFHIASDVSWGEPPATFRSLELYKKEFVFCVSKDNPLAKKSFVTIEDVKDEPIACFNQYYYYKSYLESRFAKSGLVPNVVFRTFQLSALREMVASNLACAALMQGAIDDGRDVIGLTFKPVQYWTAAITWNAAAPRNSACEDFLRFAQGFSERFRAEQSVKGGAE
ncbi:MAG: LysR family transcriptional regulator [Oscillospiraceae bacterium]|nr:LysR family transcriptional regulator [Oscillospiraceae bacterium]